MFSRQSNHVQRGYVAPYPFNLVNNIHLIEAEVMRAKIDQL
jgi:hypothetical protein